MASITCHIGIGANLGDAGDNVCAAIERLAALPDTRLSAQSSLFRSAPVDATGDDFVNAVARIDTQLSADALLAALHAIEAEFGRERTYRNAPRTIDLDLLLYGQETIDRPELVVPHPRMTERAFTLLPLLQLDPLINIPGKGPAHSFVPGVTGQAISKI
jgi:2-amino-4-hydroxy-6-hydroxymethyldihydropteridine diphosphokinase